MLWISDIILNFYKLKNNVTEIQWIFGLNFFLTSNLTFIAAETKILSLQSTRVEEPMRCPW